MWRRTSARFVAPGAAYRNRDRSIEYRRGRRHPDPAQPEGEHRVLRVAGVVVRGPVAPEHREVRLAAEPVVEGAEQVGDGLGVRPGVLEPALADLAVGPAVDPALPAIPLAGVANVAQVAVVGEGEPPRRVVEGLRVGRAERAQARRPTEVDEDAAGLHRAHALPRRVVAERRGPAVRAEAPVGVDPGRAPAEARDPVPLEPLGERPQLVEPERLRRARHELLAHRADHRRRPTRARLAGWRRAGSFSKPGEPSSPARGRVREIEPEVDDRPGSRLEACAERGLPAGEGSDSASTAGRRPIAIRRAGRHRRIELVLREVPPDDGEVEPAQDRLAGSARGGRRTSGGRGRRGRRRRASRARSALVTVTSWRSRPRRPP